MRAAAGRARAALRGLWRFVRQWSGDAAYETYRQRTAEAAPLSRQDFWLESLRRRYDRVSRCC